MSPFGALHLEVALGFLTNFWPLAKHEREVWKRCTKYVGGHQKIDLFGRPKHVWENNIKAEPHSIRCDVVDWIEQTQKRVQSWAPSDSAKTFYHQVLRKDLMDFVVILYTFFHLSLLLATWLLFKYYCCCLAVYFASGLCSLRLSTSIIYSLFLTQFNKYWHPTPILIIQFVKNFNWPRMK